MKTRLTVAVVASALLVGTAGLVVAQDAVKVDSAHYKVIFENPSVRVLRVNYAPGATSKMHQHPDSIVVFLADGKTRFESPDGKTQDVEGKANTALYIPATTHKPTNTGTSTNDAILVEFRSPKAGTATLPTQRPNTEIKPLADGPYASASMVTLAPGFSEPAGTTHDFDQVVIALGPTETSLSIAGKPAKTTWKRGDVSFIGRGTPHESKVTSASGQNVVIVAIK
jgi:quercetin dioxygenase-like cupin family protein